MHSVINLFFYFFYYFYLSSNNLSITNNTPHMRNVTIMRITIRITITDKTTKNNKQETK